MTTTTLIAPASMNQKRLMVADHPPPIMAGKLRIGTETFEFISGSAPGEVHLTTGGCLRNSYAIGTTVELGV